MMVLITIRAPNALCQRSDDPLGTTIVNMIEDSTPPQETETGASEAVLSPVPSDRRDALDRIRARGDALIEAVLEARKELDGYFASDEIVELIAQEYDGRAVAEADPECTRPTRQLRPGPHSTSDQEHDHAVLYVANVEGRPFEEANVDAILRIARSSKAPGTSILATGVGFKAVLSLVYVAGDLFQHRRTEQILRRVP